MWQPFSLIFLDTDSNGSSLLVHLSRIFQLIIHSGKWKQFLVNYKSFAFIQSFSRLVDTIHEIKCRPIFKKDHNSCLLKPFSWIFSDIPARSLEAAFSGYGGNGVFIKFFITTSAYGISINFKPCAFIQGFFSAAGKH